MQILSKYYWTKLDKLLKQPLDEPTAADSATDKESCRHHVDYSIIMKIPITKCYNSMVMIRWEIQNTSKWMQQNSRIGCLGEMFYMMLLRPFICQYLYHGIQFPK